jgi:hypothetical protein
MRLLRRAVKNPPFIVLHSDESLRSNHLSRRLQTTREKSLESFPSTETVMTIPNTRRTPLWQGFTGFLSELCNKAEYFSVQAEGNCPTCVKRLAQNQQIKGEVIDLTGDDNEAPKRRSTSP